MGNCLVQIGAGNIGRSFTGQLFRRAGYEVVFIDADADLVKQLNQAGSYRVRLRKTGIPDEVHVIDHVRALHVSDHEAVGTLLRQADLVCTAVGQSALSHVFPVVAEALSDRAAAGNERPMDILLAENMRNCAEHARTVMKPLCPAGYPFNERVGLVETSIGKMVPIMRAEDLREDPLQVIAEPYNTLIVDAHGFRNPIPHVPGLWPVDTIRAYVDRKLFIHNLGHASAAYLGYAKHPEITFIWEAIDDPEVLQDVRTAMEQAAAALHAKYPRDLSRRGLREHVDDLLDRFGNRALGDTLYRVGRDLHRKLGPEDRFIGAMRLAEKQGYPFEAIAKAFRAAQLFHAVDESGREYEPDAELLREVEQEGSDFLFKEVCGLDAGSPPDAHIIELIQREGREPVQR